MRLICPNCGAQYEVADDVIPAAGRDVQCSNCAHTWFEKPGASEMAEFAAEVVTDTSQPGDGTPDAPAHDRWDRSTFSRPPPGRGDVETPAETDPAPAVAADDDEPDLPATFADAPPAASGPAPRANFSRPPMRTVTPDVAEILREEAAREEAARKAEAATGLETQSELALDPPEAANLDHDSDAEDRISRMMAASAAAQMSEPEADTAAPPVPQSRRALLPDIEEINSTLRSASEHGPVAAEQVAQTEASNKRGFRFGFGIVLLIAAALAMVYVYTPRIIVMVPETAPILTPYADAVDSGRLWLDLQLQEILGMIDPSPQAPAEPSTSG